MARLCKSAKIVAYYKNRYESFSQDVLDVPPQVAHVWAWFWHLDKARQGGFGMQALTYSDISAWSSAVGETPRPWEIYALMDVDLSYRVAMAPVKEPDDKSAPRKTVSAYDTNAALAMFDRMTDRSDK